MRNEIAGIDAWIDPMQRASDLVGFAVVQRPARRQDQRVEVQRWIHENGADFAIGAIAFSPLAIPMQNRWQPA